MKLEHIGIAVRSLDEAVRMYTENLGLALDSCEEIVQDGVRVAMIPLGESRIELMESTSAESPVGKFLAKRGPGVHHIAIAVDDIDEALERLKVAGARLVDEVPRKGAGGTRIAFLHPSSFDGVLLELVEHAK